MKDDDDDDDEGQPVGFCLWLGGEPSSRGLAVLERHDSGPMPLSARPLASPKANRLEGS